MAAARYFPVGFGGESSTASAPRIVPGAAGGLSEMIMLQYARRTNATAAEAFRMSSRMRSQVIFLHARIGAASHYLQPEHRT